MSAKLSRDGTKASCYRSGSSGAHVATVNPHTTLFACTGVPQLSLGEKATLTATPDYVSRKLDLVRHAVGKLIHISSNRRMVLVDSHRSFRPTPFSSLKLSCSRSTALRPPAGDVMLLRTLCASLFACGMDCVLSVLHSCIVCGSPIFTHTNNFCHARFLFPHDEHGLPKILVRLVGVDSPEGNSKVKDLPNRMSEIIER